MKREIIVVDVETTGFDPDRHETVEVAWWNLDTGERSHFVPVHDVPTALAGANIRSLQINRYIDRLAEAEQDTEYVELNRLWDQLNGNTLAGSNPRFDAGFLATMFQKGNRLTTEPWHYRLWDLAPYAAGVLGLDYLPGLDDVCKELGVNRPDHSAEGDVTATGTCFTQLMGKAGSPRILTAPVSGGSGS
jgi:DNA polymerase III epsilon subunit-like protein